jgi:hypothetical protein
MDEFSTTSDTIDQADEKILTPTVSDDALEAAAGIGAGNEPSLNSCPIVWCRTDWACDADGRHREARGKGRRRSGHNG